MFRPDRSPALRALLLFALAMIGSLGCRGRDAERGNLLAGKSPSATSNVLRAGLVNDGVAAQDGDAWENHLAAVFGRSGAYVEFDLGEIVPIRAVWLQADNDDVYAISVSADRQTFHLLWSAPSMPGVGLRTRFADALEGSARYVRIQPYAGDDAYSLAEVMLFSTTPDPFPPLVSRRPGVPIDEWLRTSVLMLGLALLVWVGIGRWAGWLGWLAGLVFVGLAGRTVLEAVHLSWPAPPRAVSLVRGTIAAVAALTVLWESFAPRRLAPDRRAVLGALGVCGVLGVLAFYNLGAPQFYDARAKARTFVHLLDIRQYLATAKYFPEIGFWRIYEADVAAYAEDSGRSLDSLARLPIRDLRTNAPTTVAAMREAIESAAGRFSPARWDDYKADARLLREMMSESAWLEGLLDLGGNATPVWMSVAYLLFNAVEAGPRAFFWMSLLDPLLFAVLFVAIGQTFGLRTMLVCMTIFGANDFIMYGTNWAGAILRHDWLVALGLGICALRRERWLLAGNLFGVATSIRAFPALAVVGLSIPAFWWIVETWRARRRPPTFADLLAAQRPTLLAGFASVATVLLLALVSAMILGFDSWSEWLAKVSLLDAEPHVNPVSLKTVIAGTTEARDRLLSARWPLYGAAIAAYVGMIAVASRGKPLEQAAALGLVLVPVLLFPSNYYLHLVMLLPLIAIDHGSRAGDDRPPLDPADALAWCALLAICAVQYFTTLVPDLRLHFYLSSVILMIGLGAMLVARLAGGAR